MVSNSAISGVLGATDDDLDAEGEKIIVSLARPWGGWECLGSETAEVFLAKHGQFAVGGGK